MIYLVMEWNTTMLLFNLVTLSLYARWKYNIVLAKVEKLNHSGKNAIDL
jgi:hypothetical protein